MRPCRNKRWSEIESGQLKIMILLYEVSVRGNVRLQFKFNGVPDIFTCLHTQVGDLHSCTQSFQVVTLIVRKGTFKWCRTLKTSDTWQKSPYLVSTEAKIKTRQTHVHIVDGRGPPQLSTLPALTLSIRLTVHLSEAIATAQPSGTGWLAVRGMIAWEYDRVWICRLYFCTRDTVAESMHWR